MLPISNSIYRSVGSDTWGSFLECVLSAGNSPVILLSLSNRLQTLALADSLTHPDCLLQPSRLFFTQLRVYSTTESNCLWSSQTLITFLTNHQLLCLYELISPTAKWRFPDVSTELAIYWLWSLFLKLLTEESEFLWKYVLSCHELERDDGAGKCAVSLTDASL